MIKTYIRIVAVVLIACLLADPSLALAISSQQTKSNFSSSQISLTEQALNEAAVSVLKYILESPHQSASIRRRAAQAGFIRLDKSGVRLLSGITFLASFSGYLAIFGRYLESGINFISQLGMTSGALSSIRGIGDFVNATLDTLTDIVSNGWHVPSNVSWMFGGAVSSIDVRYRGATVLLFGVALISGMVWTILARSSIVAGVSRAIHTFRARKPKWLRHDNRTIYKTLFFVFVGAYIALGIYFIGSGVDFSYPQIPFYNNDVKIDQYEQWPVTNPFRFIELSMGALLHLILGPWVYPNPVPAKFIASGVSGGLIPLIVSTLLAWLNVVDKEKITSEVVKALEDVGSDLDPNTESKASTLWYTLPYDWQFKFPAHLRRQIFEASLKSPNKGVRLYFQKKLFESFSDGKPKAISYFSEADQEYLIFLALIPEASEPWRMIRSGEFSDELISRVFSENHIRELLSTQDSALIARDLILVLHTRWSAIESHLPAEIVVSALHKTLSLDQWGFDTGIEFLQAHWLELPIEVKNLLTPELFYKSLSGAQGTSLLGAWNLAAEHWDTIPDSLKDCFTPEVFSTAFTNVDNFSRHGGYPPVTFLDKRLASLPITMAMSALTAAFSSTDPNVRQAVRDIAFENRDWPSATRELINRIRQLDTAGIVPLQNLIASKASVAELKNAVRKIQEGGFDIQNPIHVDLNYILLRDEILAQRPLSPRDSYVSFIDMVDKVKQDRYHPADQAVDDEHLLQIRALAYEAYPLRNKILALRDRADELHLEFRVVANLSVGAVALSPIVEERDGQKYIIGTNIPVWETKVGSTESHNDEQVLIPTLFSPNQVQTMQDPQAIVVIVDASTSVGDPDRTSPHIPDGFKGYRNYGIAMNSALGVDSRAEDFFVDDQFIKNLQSTDRFREIVNRFRRTKRNASPYKFYFDYPGQKTLYLREHKKVDQAAPKLDSASKIDGPAMVFIQTAIEPEAVPTPIRDEFIKGTHKPAFFDDKDHYKQFFFDYEEGYGFHLSRSYAIRSRVAYDELMNYLGQQITQEAPIAQPPSMDRFIDTVVLDLDGTLAKTDQPLSSHAIQILYDLLTNRKKIILATDDIESNVNARLGGLIELIEKHDPSLLENLWLATDGGTYIYRFKADNGRIFQDRYNETTKFLKAERSEVLDLLHVNVSNQFEIDQRPNRTSADRRIDLRDVRDRDSFIAKVQQVLSQRGLYFRVYKAGKTSVKFVKNHKAEAVQYILKLTGAATSRTLLIADSARTNQIDRELLSRFTEGVSINVGKGSRSIGKMNPHIIQTESGIDGTLKILENLVQYDRLPMRPLLPFQHLFVESSHEDGDYDARDDVKAAASWSLSESYLYRWAHKVETQLLIPALSMALVLAPLRFSQIPRFSLFDSMFIVAMAFLLPHRERIFNSNILLMGAGTFAASGAFIASLQNLISSSSPTQLLFGLAQLIASTVAVKYLARIHWHNNNVSPLTSTFRSILSAA